MNARLDARMDLRMEARSGWQMNEGRWIVITGLRPPSQISDHLPDQARSQVQSGVRMGLRFRVRMADDRRQMADGWHRVLG